MTSEYRVILISKKVSNIAKTLDFSGVFWYNLSMSEQRKISQDELNNLSKETVIMLFMQLRDSFDVLQGQNEKLLKQIESLQESVAVLTQQRFGRKTEKVNTFDGQYTFDLETMNIINEAEKLLDDGEPKEPEIETVVKAHVRKKTKGKRQEDLSKVEHQIEEHYLSEEQLNEIFPDGYTRLPDEVYTNLEFVPAKFIAKEHHVGVYTSKGTDHTFARGDHPVELLKSSILTPSLAAGIFNYKYVDAMPLNRISEEFRRNDVEISRQVMAGWMIKIADRYIRIIYNAMKKEIIKSKLIHCDETPFKLVDDGRSANSKNYMWVYHSIPKYESPPIFIYEYQPTRKTDHPREFLKDYEGILMTDGYQVYHTLEKENPGKINVAGCWAHCKRKFAEIVKSTGTKTKNGIVAAEAVERITAIYHVDNMTKGKSAEEILNNRKVSVKPLVDAFFAWVKPIYESSALDKSGKAYKAIQYAVNQEQYLRKFLDNAIIPLDNNDAERSIKAFCVGKHSWHIIDSKNGAEASAILYSIAETAKANGLKPYEYFKYALEEILKHQDDPLDVYLNDILPWSDALPDSCRKQINK